MEFDLYDATPEPGKPLSWSVNIYHDHDDHSNFGWLEKIDCTLTEQPISPLVKEYTFTPAKPGRYLLMPTIRVDSWRMVDDRSFWIDSHSVKTPRPFTFRCVLKQNQHGPEGTGNTTVLQCKNGTLIVRIETGKPGNIFQVGEPMTYTVSLEGPSGTVQVMPVLIDWKGNRVPQAAWEAKLAPDASVKHTLSIQPPGVGFYRLQLEIPGWGEAWLDGGVLPPAPEMNDRIGINVSWSDRYRHSEEKIEEDAKLLAMQGVRWLRTEYEWRTGEGVRGTYYWYWFDFLRDVCQKHDMKMLPAIFRIPPWASPNPNAPDYFHHCMNKEYFEDYYRFVEAIAKRYKSWIRYYSIWNEVDSSWFQGGTAGNYAEILRNCYKRIKAIDPNLKITCSGFSSTGVGTGADFFRDVLKQKGANFFDVLDIHYVNRAATESFKKDLRKHSRQKKPLWITEQGGGQIDNRTLAAAAKQASDKIENLLIAYVANPDKLFLWGDVDQHPNLCLWGNVTGEDRTPRPAYFAFATFIRLLSHRCCVETYSETPELQAFRFRAPDDREDILVLWSQSGMAVGIQGVGAKVKRIDLMGNITELPTTNGGLVLGVDSEPVFLVLDYKPSAVMPVAVLERRQISLSPGKAGPIRILLNNPWPDNRSFRITGDLPAGWRLEPKHVQRDLSGNQRAVIEMQLHIPANAPVGQLVPFAVRVEELMDKSISVGGAVRIQTKAGVMLIEAESASRSQGQCPGAPMHIGGDASASGQAIVLMFWGGGWMEYDIPFGAAGVYELGVRAQGRFQGHADETKASLELIAYLDGHKIGTMRYPLGWATRNVKFHVAKAGVHTIKLLYAVDAGDIFVDFLTIEKATKSGSGRSK